MSVEAAPVEQPAQEERLQRARQALRAATGTAQSAGASQGAGPSQGAGSSTGSSSKTASGSAAAQPAELVVYPVCAELAAVLPWYGLRGGSAVAVPDSLGLLLALLAESSAAGQWVAVVDVPELGAVAAAEYGLDLERTVRITRAPHGGSAPAQRQRSTVAEVVGALLEGVSLVAFRGCAELNHGQRQRLTAKARKRQAVLLPLDSWPGADVQLHAEQPQWHGLERGYGRLRSATATVRVHGRRVRHGQAASTRVLLPASNGRLAAPEAAGPHPQSLRAVP